MFAIDALPTTMRFLSKWTMIHVKIAVCLGSPVPFFRLVASWRGEVIMALGALLSLYIAVTSVLYSIYFQCGIVERGDRGPPSLTAKVLCPYKYSLIGRVHRSLESGERCLHCAVYIERKLRSDFIELGAASPVC